MDQVSFILPVRIDNEDRLIDLKTILGFLTNHFKGSEILVLEDDSKSNCQHWIDQWDVTYVFLKNSGPFARSHVLNQGLLLAKNEVAAIYDIDCLINPDLLRKGAKKILKTKSLIIFPHNEIWVNVKDSLKQSIIRNPEAKNFPYFRMILKKKYSAEITLYSISSGVVLFNRELLIKIGGFNEKMISYGWEDIEVLKRASKLGIYYYCLNGASIIHLHHERGEHSQQNEYYKKNKEIFLKTIRMPAKNLLNYINEELSISKYLSLTQEEISQIRWHNLFTLAYFRFVMNRIHTKIRNGKLLNKLTNRIG